MLEEKNADINHGFLYKSDVKTDETNTKDITSYKFYFKSPHNAPYSYKEKLYTLQLDEAIRASERSKNNEWSINAIHDCKIEVKIGKRNLLKWMKTVFLVTNHILQIPKDNTELIPTETTFEDFEQFMLTAIKITVKTMNLHIINDEKIYKISEFILFYVKNVMPLLYELNKIYASFGDEDVYCSIKDDIEQFKALMCQIQKQKKMPKYIKLGETLWRILNNFKTISIHQSISFMLVQIGIFFYADEIITTTPKSMIGVFNVEQESQEFTIYDVFANIIGTRLKIHILTPENDVFIRFISKMVCNTSNKKFDIDSTKNIIVNSLFNKFKSEFVNANFISKLSLQSKNSVSKKLENIFCNCTTDQNLILLHRKLVDFLTKKLEADNYTNVSFFILILIPYLYLINSDRREYMYYSYAAILTTIRDDYPNHIKKQRAETCLKCEAEEKEKEKEEKEKIKSDETVQKEQDKEVIIKKENEINDEKQKAAAAEKNSSLKKYQTNIKTMMNDLVYQPLITTSVLQNILNSKFILNIITDFDLNSDVLIGKKCKHNSADEDENKNENHLLLLKSLIRQLDPMIKKKTHKKYIIKK